MANVMDMEGRFLFKKGGDMFFIAKTIDDRLPQPVLQHVARWLPNQAVTWRHESPRKPEYSHQPIFGRVEVAKAFTGGIASIIRLYGNSSVPSIYVKRQALQELVKKSVEFEKNIGLSLVYDDIKINKETAEAEPMEVGVTRRPDCVTCTLKYGVKKMVENEKKEPATETKEKVQEALEKATIDELQSLLEEKVTELEAEKKTAAETIKNEVGKVRTELESKDKAFKELEKNHKDLSEKFSKLTAELDGAKRKPYIDALKAEDKKSVFSDKMLTSLEIKDIQEITAKLKEQNDVLSKIKVTSLETSAEKAQTDQAPTPKLKKVEECETEEELKLVLDIDTAYGKEALKRLKERKKGK